MKPAIIRLKKKTLREIAKTLGVAKSANWNILQNKERTGELRNTKGPGKPWKTTVVDDRRKAPSQQLARSRTLSRRLVYLCQSQQSREDFTRVNTEGLLQDVNHW